MKKILIIQTAFIGDVVLATAVIENLKHRYPDAQIDFLLQKGIESLLANNPHLGEVITWNKKDNKYRTLFSVIRQIRKNKYDLLINLQRFFATGFITVFSGARERIGFDKNPLSFLFSKKVKHIVSSQPPYKHEVERNKDLLKDITDDTFSNPRLYPSKKDFTAVHEYTTAPFVTMTPSSVWFTKKYPDEKWIDLLNNFPSTYNIYLLGGKDNMTECENLVLSSTNTKITVLAGQLSLLQSAALMKDAVMNYVNDSAPLHFASAMNAPVTAIFCSTVPAFGFTPLSDKSFIIETKEVLSCRPCGLHGKKVCPLGHFKCGFGIETSQVLSTLSH